ncbi:MAG: glycine dehydrogenase, partial [Chloroflexi bacterium]|nr:glycine dehydrogenase [Chloroflexota bacterium]
MRYLPQTDADVRQMLETIGVAKIDDLFSGIPESCRLQSPLKLSPALCESESMAVLRSLAEQNAQVSEWDSFLGGGAYNHFIP